MSQLEVRGGSAGAWLAELARSAGVALRADPGRETRCPHLALASSGALFLTGAPGGAPAVCELPLVERTAALCRAIGTLSSRRGARVELEGDRVLVERAAERAFVRRGAISANGSCRLISCNEGWLACNLPRPDDPAMLAAALAWAEPPGEPFERLAEDASRTSAAEMVARLGLVGIAASVLGESVTDEPLRLLRLGAPAPVRRPRVVDFSAMWAGPLCAHILGRAGADVVRVEDPARPDGSRTGDPAMYERLRRGHGLAACSFSSAGGVRELHRLVEDADIVIESSRPRALAGVGFGPEAFVAGRPGRIWISITGYGRSGARAARAAFGDDAAVAGGLVAWMGGEPVFVADALADPVSGLMAAFGGLVALGGGGGLHVEVSMSASAAFAARGGGCPGRHGVRRDERGHWFATHDADSVPVRSPAEALGGG